jgi:hypothetical protein
MAIVFWQFFQLSNLLLSYFFDVAEIAIFFKWVLVGLYLCIVAGVLRAWLRQKISLVAVAKEIETRSEHFEYHPMNRSELVSAASFLDSSEHFEKAHLEFWETKLESFRVLIYPRRRFWLFLLGVVLIFAIQSIHSKRFSVPLPKSPWAWHLSEYEFRLPTLNARWIEKRGTLSVMTGSRVRFLTPDHSPFKTYVFLQSTADGVWRKRPCETYCEFSVDGRMNFSVGTLVKRSPVFPALAIEDEPPRPIIFLKEQNELIPHPSIRIANRKSVLLELVASDDLALESVVLKAKHAGSERELFRREVSEMRFKEDYQLDLEDWPGGQSEIVLIAKDSRHVQESKPLILFFENEDFLREQRLISLRSLIDQWVHVLADLLEGDRDKRIHPSTFERFDLMEWPEQDMQGALKVFVEGLRRLEETIRRDLGIGDTRRLPVLIERVEKQILYGLSLILQERTGDINQSTREFNASQDNLQKLLNDIKSGKDDLSSESLQQAFDKLIAQIEELQNKIKNLPQGPSDQMINREALEEQLSQSEELQEKINQIQEQIARGAHGEALRELESLMNQLSILSKEISRSFEQWQENLAKGAGESSKKFVDRLEELKSRQEDIVQKTNELQDQMKNQARRGSENQSKEMKAQGEKLRSEQDQLAQEFDQLVREFREDMEGSEWEQIFLNSEMIDLQSAARERMSEATRSLEEMNLDEAVMQEKESAEILTQMSQFQKDALENLETMSQPGAAGQGQVKEKTEIIDSEGRGQRERRQKIMNSLKHKVNEEFQKSHERYFEELLQR